MVIQDGSPAVWRTVVGVARHVRERGPTRRNLPQVYFPLAQRPFGNLYVTLATSGPVDGLLVAVPAGKVVEATLAGSEHGRANPYLDRLVIKDRGRIFFLKIRSIDWIEACADYVSLHVGPQSWLLRRTMAEMEERLDQRLFVRVNRSAIVNLERVRDLVPAARGEHFVRLVGGNDLKLTRGYRERLEQLLGDRL